MSVHRRKLRHDPEPVLRVTTRAMRTLGLVYLLVAHKPIRYARGASRIAYVGTTERGIDRVASSAAHRVQQASKELRGFRYVDAYIVWTSPRSGRHKKDRPPHRTLERAFLLRFRDIFGVVPRLNKQGHKLKEQNEFQLFSRGAVGAVIVQFGAPLPAESAAK